MLPIPGLRKRHRELWRLVLKNWVRLLGAMGCMLLMAVSTSATAFLVKPVLDDIFFNKDVFMLRLIPLAVIVIYLLRGVGYYGQAYLMNYVGQGIIKDLRDALFERIVDMPLSFYQSEKTGALMSRVTYDVNVIKNMVSTSITGALRDCFTIGGLTCVIFYRDWKLAVFALIVLPAAFYPIVQFGRRVRKVSTGCQEAMADLSSYMHETFAGNKIVKAFGMEAYEKERFLERTARLFGLEMRATIARSLSSPIMEFLGGLGIAFVVWYGGYQVIKGASTAGTFFSFMAAVLMLYDPVKKLTGVNNAVQEGMAAADRVFDIIERDTDIAESPNPVVLERGPHTVAFRDVSFKYDTQMVLNGINLEANAGEVVALVGMSGGGKSSLVNLIPRFFEATEGSITIDGVDIRDVSIASLRQQIAVVTQEPILFNDTIRNNIAYGKADASEAEIIQASKAAYAHDFIQGFPKGFDSLVGELGGRVSGGEKQRLCIARALLKDAPILILDEATSSLDSESEQIVQKALDNLIKGRTTFVVAHRLSSIRHADQILVIADGKIVEKGRHEDLMAHNGEYCKLYQLLFADNRG
ncbi:ABC transporter ATP-binding protein [Thermodesulfobacteriota bacterium]